MSISSFRVPRSTKLIIETLARSYFGSAACLTSMAALLAQYTRVEVEHAMVGTGLGNAASSPVHLHHGVLRQLSVHFVDTM